MTEVSYVPGDRTAIVGTCCWALVDAAPDSAAVAEIWPRMEHASQLDALVASLLRSGLEHAPDFVLLVAAEGRHRLICRGQASATLAAGESPERVDGTGLATWREYPVPPAVRRIVLGEPPARSDLQLPASAGVLLASSVTVDLTAAPHVPGLKAPPAVPVPPDPSAGPGPDEDSSYDFLWGPTQARTLEEAAVRPAAEGQGGPPFPSPVAAPLPPVVASPPPVAAAGPPPPSGLIDAVPWASDTGRRPVSVPPVPAPPPLIAPAPAASSDADDGSTVMRGDLLKRLSGPAAPDRIGPTVHALLCPSAHVNPPSRSACRSCGAPLPQQDPVLVPRPVLGVLRLSTGDAITLDRGVVMGRSPRTDFDGEERPHVVKLPSGDGEISRTHLQVSLDGWHVLVTDLNSTNGTLMVLPGRDPERLRPGEPTPIPPGTLVILAVGVDFRYEAAE
jgi:hypothetical protein